MKKTARKVSINDGNASKNKRNRIKLNGPKYSPRVLNINKYLKRTCEEVKNMSDFINVTSSGNISDDEIHEIITKEPICIDTLVPLCNIKIKRLVSRGKIEDVI